MKMHVSFCLYLFIVLVSSCSLAPDYQRPDAPIPDEWSDASVGKEFLFIQNALVPAKMEWQDFVIDENLRQVIGLALENNRDLRVAVLNVQKAQALYGVQRAELLPAVNTVASGVKQRVPADLSVAGESAISEQYGVNLGFSSWEIDIFGRIRSLKDRALEEYLALEQTRRGAQISLISAVARAYLALAADRETLALARATLESQQAAYALIEKRLDTGIASMLDLLRVQTQVDTARNNVAVFTQLVAQDKNALNFLAGSTVPDEYLPATLRAVGRFRETSAGVSSEILLQRPDIMAMEHRLKAANANIGAARAAFFPRISLTAVTGTASAELSGLFESGSEAWSVSPQASMAIFDLRLGPALKASKLEKEIAVAQYEKSIQSAFKDVMDALATQATLNDRLVAQQSLVNAASEAYRLANTSYLNGVESYLSVLEAQRSLYTAQSGFIATRHAKLVNHAQIYAVLGGGGHTERPDA